MAVHTIAYVELYTRDKMSVVDHLVSDLGFARVADSVAADRSSILLRRQRTQLAVTSGRGVWKYLDEFGDGVADIALTCDDVASTRGAVVAAGARAARSAEGTVVSGFGVDALTHTLVAPARPGFVLPVGRRWVPAEAGTGADVTAGAASPGPVVDHIGIGVERADLARCAAFYRAAFGFRTVAGPGAGEPLTVRDDAGNLALVLSGPAPDAEPGRPGARYLALSPVEPAPGGRPDPAGLIRLTGDPATVPGARSTPGAGRELAQAAVR